MLFTIYCWIFFKEQSTDVSILDINGEVKSPITRGVATFDGTGFSNMMEVNTTSVG